jgi:putative PIN family toxin of toxin-antitoxin system
VIVVLDTNVLVAAMVAKGLCHEVVVRSLGSCTVATSQPLLEELERTLRAKFTLGPAVKAFLTRLRVCVRIVEPTPLGAPVSRDADDDDVVLATAVAAGARVIVTGDQDLLVIGPYDGIDIISPREFLGRLSP